MQLKRLWDITNKKMVFVKGPTGHECQLWVDESTGNMYYYDMAQWLEYEQSAANDGKTYGPTWKVVDGDDDMGVYDTDKPTDLFVWEDGDEVSYVFKDWDGTVLKEGKVKEGTEPTPPANPIREGYTFDGWNPAVAPITRKTTYTATYTINQYTVTFVDDDGTTVLDEQTLDYGATPVYAGETPTKEPTAQYTYTFSGWNPEIGPVSGNTTYTAVYSSVVNQYTVTISADPTEGSVDENSLTVDYGTAFSSSSNVLTVGDTEVTATAESGYSFDAWSPASGTVTGNVTISATFQQAGPSATYTYSTWTNSVDLQARLTADSTGIEVDGSALGVECQKFIDGVYDSSTYMVIGFAYGDGEVSSDEGGYVFTKCGSDSSIISYQYITEYQMGMDFYEKRFIADDYKNAFSDPTLMNDNLWQYAMSWAENPFTITTTVSGNDVTIYTSLGAGTDKYSVAKILYNTSTEKATLLWDNQTFNYISDQSLSQTLSDSGFLTAGTISSPTLSNIMDWGNILSLISGMLASSTCEITLVADPVGEGTVAIEGQPGYYIFDTPFADEPTENGDRLAFWIYTAVATANAGYEFVSWDCPAMILKDTVVYARFQEVPPL